MGRMLDCVCFRYLNSVRKGSKFRALKTKRKKAHPSRSPSVHGDSLRLSTDLFFFFLQHKLLQLQHANRQNPFLLAWRKAATTTTTTEHSMRCFSVHFSILEKREETIDLFCFCFFSVPFMYIYI